MTAEAALNTEQADVFADIRPYRDEEISAVIARLVDDREFIDTLAGMKFAKLSRWLPWVVRPIIHTALHRRFGHLSNVRSCQELIGGLLRALLEDVADGVFVDGLAALAPDQQYLFLGNHRDIAMDAAMVNLALVDGGLDTVRIAIGDNLLTKPFTSDLMRLNKSFIVRRSATGRREKLTALKHLSAFIAHSLTDERQSIWIAQREGRAKDGIDSTETALLKMLVLNKAQDDSFGEAFARLNVVPVSVSYEWDPCDALKARELYAIQTDGVYIKDEHEDIESIYQGIMGDKGRIDVVFGQLLTQRFADAEAAAQAVDRQIIKNYRLQASHLVAHQRIYGDCEATRAWRAEFGALNWQQKIDKLSDRLSKVPKHHRDIMLTAYANPVQRRLELDV